MTEKDPRSEQGRVRHKQPALPDYLSKNTMKKHISDTEENLKNTPDDFRNSMPSLVNFPKFSQTTFCKGIYLLASEEETGSEDSVRYKFDNAYYHALKEIDWHVFLTLKFRKKGYSGLSNAARWHRKQHLWEVGSKVRRTLSLSSNDLHYFWSEEVNSDRQAHYHVLFHRVYEDKCTVENLRKTLEDNLDPEVIQLPRTTKGQEPPHIQTVKSNELVVRYLLKTPLFQSEEKVFGHSHKFVRFWNRHMNWKRKQAA